MMARVRRAPVVVLLLALAAVDTRAQVAGRLLDSVDFSTRPGHVDISLIFGCGLRYLSHLPASKGDVLRVRVIPLPDCGDIGGTMFGQVPPMDPSQGVRSIDVDQLAGTELMISIRFKSEEQFVLAPSSDSHGLRIRLLRPESRGSTVFIGETAPPPAGYAVNLESSREPFTEEAVRHAAQAAGVPAYVAEFQLGEEKWYRLRIGPFKGETDARQALRAMRGEYPKAWLAIGDDATLTAPGSEAQSVAALPTLPQANASLTAQDIDALFGKAKSAFGHKDYAGAIPILTKLLEQPEFPRRAEAQELMGLSRERSRQIAHAKAEYEEYLRRYPDGRAVKRVRERLRALALAARASRTGGGGGEDDEKAWKFFGGVSQLYRRDDTQIDNGVQSTNITSLNALLSDVDLVARRRGDRFDVSTRLSAGYVKDLLSGGPGDQTRVTTAFIELADREREWKARLGRQSRNSGGLFGTFDGIYAGYQVRPRLGLNLAFGYPVERTTDSPQTGRQFIGIALDLGTFREAWDFSLYGVSQRLAGETDRQAVGTEVRYFKPGRTLVALIDYDIHFQELNNALVLGTLELPGRWILGVNLDHRRSPSLSLRNALIGQPVTTFDDLLTLFTPAELDQLALDRSADSDLYSVSLSRPFGERWQWTLDLASLSTGATPGSGGVDPVPDSGRDNSVGIQGLASGLFGGNDFSSIVLRHQESETVSSDSLGLATRFALWENWRLGPRLRVDRREFLSDGSQQWLYVPTLRLELQRSRTLFEFEAGAEIGRRDFGGFKENTTRYYFSLGYRLNF
jgi:tetratricopeptide (TPR) repeat protein